MHGCEIEEAETQAAVGAPNGTFRSRRKKCECKCKKTTEDAKMQKMWVMRPLLRARWRCDTHSASGDCTRTRERRSQDGDENSDGDGDGDRSGWWWATDNGRMAYTYTYTYMPSLEATTEGEIQIPYIHAYGWMVC